MKKLLYLLLCAGLCFGCSNTSDTDDTKADDSEIIEETTNLVTLTDEENENIQKLLVCMNYGNEDNAYIDNLFNYVFDSYYSFDGFNLAQVPDLDQAMMVLDDEIGYNVCSYYLESIANIDIESDMEKSIVATPSEGSEYVYVTINRTEEDTEFNFTDYIVSESQLGDGYYIVEYTISDGTETYENCCATIYKNAHSWFGYSIFEFSEGENKDIFVVYDDVATSNTDITSISSESGAQEYIEAYLETQGLAYDDMYVLSSGVSVFDESYYALFMVDDEYYDAAVMADTGMIINLDHAALVDSDLILVDAY
ncbi:MAG: hypothetical protein LUG46_03995 [Erysipelotrichaceae bacterium]|nr:hypothetical protein [Erysipelotrichaceae bacterium]